MQDIKIKNLNYCYPEMKTPALKNINLEIPQGQFVLLVGGSGSGKSTLLRSICGLIPNFYGGVYSGEIYIGSDEIHQINRRELTQRIGMVFQDPESQLVMTNVEEEIAFGLENLNLPNSLMKRRVMEVSSALSLSSYLNNFIPELSGGQKQKTALGAVLAMQPDIILLDEPTSQLDPIAGEDILTMIRRLNEENGITVILTEQRLERCFHLADRILVMDKGEIIFDNTSPKEIAKWAVKTKRSFVPPLSKLFAEIDFYDIPITVKEGRRIIRDVCNNEENLNNEYLFDCEKESSSPVIEIENLWFTYPNGKEVLKDISFNISSGDFIVLMGENGGGKTTLLKNLNGLLKPSRGKVKIMGKDTRKIDVEQIAHEVGYLSQDPNDYLFLPSVEEEILFTMKNLGIDDDGMLDEIIDRLQLRSLKDKNPRDLSTGERQRVALASILITRPKILLLDEPTRGLDYELKEKLGKILLELKSEGTAIFMVAHDVEFAAEYADKIILLDRGSIIGFGDKHEMLTNSTFYSPQISKLFYGLADNIVTKEEGKKILKAIMGNKNI
ncbi:ABC transporter ATP-binding protein [Caminicella sporogenes]|uniref:ABC transporter ATP-binding protein n=1 Tax=Caminicella sporogenes TaxID=166485 RepID=UPI00253FA435|nr:ABC transporter ATP-binding protein [Caminicella sporogenes]WIF95418.1 energy-coupling factor transporter ATPase [Caminicella sporogenes]